MPHVSPSDGVTLPRSIKVRLARPNGSVAEGALTPGAKSLRLSLAKGCDREVMLAAVRSAVIGERSSNPRIVAVRAEEGGYQVTLDALARSAVSLRVQRQSSPPFVADGSGVRVQKIPADFLVLDSPLKRFTIHAALAEVAMPASGADQDGYVRREIVLRAKRGVRETTERQQKENRETTVPPVGRSLLSLCCFSVVFLLYFCS